MALEHEFHNLMRDVLEGAMYLKDLRKLAIAMLAYEQLTYKLEPLADEIVGDEMACDLVMHEWFLQGDTAVTEKEMKEGLEMAVKLMKEDER